MYSSSGNKKLTLDEKLGIGLKVHNKNNKRINEGFTGKVILHFNEGEIVYYEPNYKIKLSKKKNM